MEKVYIRQIFSFICVLCLSVLILVACEKTEIEEESSPNILSNIYNGVEYKLPKDCFLVKEFTPEYNTETHVLTVYAESSEEHEDEEGIITRMYTGGFYSFSNDGTITDTNTFSLPENTRITTGTFTEDAVYYVTDIYDRNTGEREYYVNRMDRTTGETITSEDMIQFFSVYDVPNMLCVDGEGDIYISGQTCAICIRPDLTYISSIEPENYLFSMIRLKDGSVGICSNYNGYMGIAKVDKEKGQLEEDYRLTQDTRTLLSASKYEGEYDFYFVDKTTVWGAKFEEDGSLIKEALMDLTNSGVVNAAGGFDGEGASYPVAVMGKETFMFAQSGTSLEPGLTPVLYHPADDLVLDSIRTITIAHAETLQPELSSQIIMFNKKNPDIQIVTKDYSSYTTEDDPDAAHHQLTFDIVNGFCEPDIIIGDANDPEIEQIYNNKLYVDLTSYLEVDDTVNLNNLLGCIRRAFDDGNHGMWGISSGFTFRTLISTKEMLGKYADKGCWTLEDMLDYLESLPRDVEKMPGAMQSSADFQMLCQGYGLFIDRESASCSFDSELFKRYLTYITALPADGKELQKTSDFIKLSDAEQYAARVSGKVGLEIYAMWYAESCFEPIGLFGTNDYIPIGFATNTDSGTQITPEEVYVITTFSEVPDVCWELVKSFFEEDDIFTGEALYALKSQLEAAMDYYADKEIAYYFDGRYDCLVYDPEKPRTEQDLEEPGLIIRFTENDQQKLLEFLNNEGNPIMSQTPDMVREIVREEISVLTGGLGTVEDCAKKIQSRVSIWLSENH